MASDFGAVVRFVYVARFSVAPNIAENMEIRPKRDRNVCIQVSLWSYLL
jgi:hypothetical protein